MYQIRENVTKKILSYFKLSMQNFSILGLYTLIYMIYFFDNKVLFPYKIQQDAFK